MKKLISMMTAFTLCGALTGALVPAERDISAYAAESETTEIDDKLPTSYEECFDFMDTCGTISTHGKYLVMCGYVGDIDTIDELSFDLKGEGSVKLVKKCGFEIPEDKDWVGYLVLEGDRSGGVHADLMRKSEYYDNTWKIWSTELYVDGDNCIHPRGEYANGDANCDGVVTVADAAAILQYLGNGDKFPLSAEGKIFADTNAPGKGITTFDAVAIQKKLLGMIETLPVDYWVDSFGNEYWDCKEYFDPDTQGKYAGVSYMNVKKNPDKTVYKIGEELDLTGIRFSGTAGAPGINIDMFDAEYGNGEISCDTSEFDNTKPGEYTLWFYFVPQGYCNIDFQNKYPASVKVTVIEG